MTLVVGGRDLREIDQVGHSAFQRTRPGRYLRSSGLAVVRAILRYLLLGWRSSLRGVAFVVLVARVTAHAVATLAFATVHVLEEVELLFFASEALSQLLEVR